MILRIQAVVLAFLLVMPVVFTSIVNLGDTDYRSELCGNFPEEEKEERKSDRDREVDEVEKFVSHHRHDFSSFASGNLATLSACNLFASINGDVLTPPPEFI